jgi:tetratricopeptide (TPR) repeat protein
MAPVDRRPRIALLAAAALAAGGGSAWLLLRRAPPPAPPAPGPIEEQVAAWREAGRLPAAAGEDPALAEVRLAEARAALAADLPGRTEEALRALREAVALAPRRSAAAIAGYATAFAEAAGDDADGPELRAAHALVREALAGGPRPDLHAAYARLLLAAPGDGNVAEAIRHASQAVSADPTDAGARLALGLALGRRDPGEAARVLEEAARAAPEDRRLLTAAARARWAAGDGGLALALAERRLALDPLQPSALELQVEVLAACDRADAARAVLERWSTADPSSAVAPLLLARLAYQRDGDLPRARRLLDDALSRRPDDFVAARALAHRAAVELAAGDVPAAEGAVAAALARVPGSAPARWQAAVLAFRRGDARALRESAGVLGERGGAGAARLLAARSAELSGTYEDARDAYLAVAAQARDPAVLLGVAAALARLDAGGPSLDVARRALERDPAEARLRRAPTDFWEGPAPLAEASSRLEAIARVESRGAAEAYAAAAFAELALGRPAAVERLARLAADASPQALAPAVALAQVALDRGRARQALAVAVEATRADPRHPVAMELRARALEALGRPLEAERWHRAAAEAGPALTTPRLALARLAARRGEAAEARALLEPLLREDPGLAEVRGELAALPPAAAPQAARP